MLHDPAASRAFIAGSVILLLAILTGCQGAQRTPAVRMFVGAPVLSSLRPEILALHALDAPRPAVRRLQLAVRVTANGKPLGNSVEVLGKASEGYSEYMEEGAYRATNGSCTLSSRNQAVAAGGFLVVLEIAEIWSADCGGGGKTRSEATRMQIVSGRLFPLQVGNRLALRYMLLESGEGTPEGAADQARPVAAEYEVIERVPDLRTASGRSAGEAFVVRVTENRRGKPSTFQFTYSTALGWRVGYKTDLTAELVDWSR